MKTFALDTSALLTLAMLLMADTMSASAQPSDAAERCTPDVMRLCSELIPDADRITGCLKAKRRQLSPECAETLSPKRKRLRFIRPAH
jgi:hypothetical protein